VTITWAGSATTKLQKATTLRNPSWTDVPNSAGASSVTEPIQGASAFYRLVR
jgi:hypothetical protein